MIDPNPTRETNNYLRENKTRLADQCCDRELQFRMDVLVTNQLGSTILQRQGTHPKRMKRKRRPSPNSAQGWMRTLLILY